MSYTPNSSFGERPRGLPESGPPRSSACVLFANQSINAQFRAKSSRKDDMRALIQSHPYDSRPAHHRTIGSSHWERCAVAASGSAATSSLPSPLQAEAGCRHGAAFPMPRETKEKRIRKGEEGHMAKLSLTRRSFLKASAMAGAAATVGFAAAPSAALAEGRRPDGRRSEAHPLVLPRVRQGRVRHVGHRSGQQGDQGRGR